MAFLPAYDPALANSSGAHTLPVLRSSDPHCCAEASCLYLGGGIRWRCCIVNNGEYRSASCCCSKSRQGRALDKLDGLIFPTNLRRRRVAQRGQVAYLRSHSWEVMEKTEIHKTGQKLHDLVFPMIS